MNEFRFIVRSHRRLWGKRWTFQLVAVGNREPLLQSEPYTSQAAALHGIEVIRAHAPTATVVLPTQHLSA